jgi:hypothetical protein
MKRTMTANRLSSESQTKTNRARLPPIRSLYAASLACTSARDVRFASVSFRASMPSTPWTVGLPAASAPALFVVGEC